MKSNTPVYETVFDHASKRSIMVFERSDTVFAPFWHFHPEIELTLITSGQGIRFVGDNIERYHAGDLVLIGENLPHHWVSQATDSVKPQEAVVVQFQRQLLQATAAVPYTHLTLPTNRAVYM